MTVGSGFVHQEEGAVFVSAVANIYQTGGNPGVNNDAVDTAGIGQNFAEGDIWINTTADTAYICVDDSAGAAVWNVLGTGGGDVTGPAGATDNAIARYDGATGKLLQDSIPTITDSGGLALSSAYAIGAAPTEATGLVLRNSTAAAWGAQQYGPPIYIAGQGWGLGAGASEEVIWRLTNTPVQGASASTALEFATSLDGAAYAAKFYMNSAGDLLWGTDGVGSIGAVAATRPANVYAATSINVGGGASTLTSTGLSVGTGGGFTASSTAVLGASGASISIDDKNLLWVSDGGGAIGAAAATRPSAIHVVNLMAAQSAMDILDAPTEAHGIVLRNTSAATGIAQQGSPPVYEVGQGWDAGPGATTDVIWRKWGLPIAGNPPMGQYRWDFALGAGAFSTRMEITSWGLFTVSDGTNSVYVRAGDATGHGIGNDSIYNATDNVLQLRGVRSDGAGNISLALDADVDNATINATHKTVSFGWINHTNTRAELGYVTGDGGLTMVGAASFAGATLTGDLLFSADATHDIGAVAATRPANVYAATSVNVANSYAVLDSTSLEISSAMAIGVTPTEAKGLVLRNTTAATGGVPEQWSPAVYLAGQGRETAGGTSVEAVWRIYNRVYDSATGGGTLRFDFSLDGAAYSNRVQLIDSGTLTCSDGTGTLLFAPSTTGIAAVQWAHDSLFYVLGGRSSGSGNISLALDAFMGSAIDAGHKVASFAYWDATYARQELAWVTGDGRVHAASAFSLSSALAIGVTPTEAKGLVLRNATAAADGAQQYSPSIFLAGQGWETAGSSSDEVVWRITNVPVQGAAASTNLVFAAKIDVAAYVDRVSISSTGSLLVGTAGINPSYMSLYSATNIWGSVNNGSGLGSLAGISDYSARALGFSVAGNRDSANNFIIASAWARGAAVTNTATIRLHTFGASFSSGVYTELHAVMADGCRIGGPSKCRVAEAAAGAIVQHVGTGTAGTAAAAATITAGLKTMVQVETLSPNAVETALATAIPAGSVIRAVLANVQTALTGGGTTVTWSVGTSADPDKYGTAGYPTPADALTQNSKSNWCGAVQVTADETIVLTGAATGGADDGDTALTVGSVKIMVVYDTFDAIPDA